MSFDLIFYRKNFEDERMFTASIIVDISEKIISITDGNMFDLQQQKVTDGMHAFTKLY